MQNEQGEALELVRAGETLLRIENETLQAAAITHPRKEEQILSGALRELELVPELASTAYYSIPYKETNADGTSRSVQVTGPSIKAANALARRWGNCSVSCRVVGEDDGSVDVEGVFIDFETMYRRTAPVRISKVFKRRSGSVEVLAENRLTMRIQAGVSKAIRNATLNGLPPYLVQAYDRRAREIVGGKQDEPAAEKTVQAVITSFGKWQVNAEALEQYAGKPTKQWTGLEVAELRGLWNAINDGQITVSEAFGIAGEATGPDLMPKQTPPSPEPVVPNPVDAEPSKPSAPQNKPPDQPNGKANRTAIFTKLRDVARKRGVKEYVLIRELTGKGSMQDLSDEECFTLDKKLDA